MTVALKDAKVIGGNFRNERNFAKARYSFAEDGGATGALVAFTCKTALIIHGVNFRVETAPLSGGSALCSFGISSDNDLFIDSIAKATLAINTLQVPVVTYTLTEGTPNTLATSYPLPKYVAADETLDFAIEAAALTAGVIWIEVEYSAPY